MKKNLLLPIAALFLFACSTDGYKITGAMEGGENNMVYLQRVVSSELVNIDSVAMRNGKFTFQGRVDVPDLYALQFGEEGDRLVVFLDNADVNIKGSADRVLAAEISGSESHNLMLRFNTMQESMSQKLLDINLQYKNAASDGTLTPGLEEQLRGEFIAENDKLIEFAKNFALEHHTSPVSAYITLRHLAHQIDFASLDAIVSKFPETIQNSPFVTLLNERVTLERKTAIGQPYTNFTLASPQGALLPLSSLVGTKYFLIDFWAAWCGPCRKENPHLVKIYKQFKPLGFEILGVSLDRDHEAWVEAIKKDGLTWPQVSDLKGWESAVVPLYGVNSIPANVLLDQGGTIVAKNVMGEDLSTLLLQLFSK